MPWAHIIERIQAVYLGIEAGIPTYVPCSPRDLILDFGEAEPTLSRPRAKCTTTCVIGSSTRCTKSSVMPSTFLRPLTRWRHRVRCCSSDKMFHEILQNWQDNGGMHSNRSQKICSEEVFDC